jgi:ketosteroid isomerase-like protein
MVVARPAVAASAILPIVSEDIEQTMRAGYAAFDRGDFDEAVRMLHPDFRWVPGANSPSPTPLESRELFRKMLEPDTFEQQRVEVEDVIVRGNRALVEARFRIRGRGSGIEMENTFFHLWTFDGELAASCALYVTRDEALTALEQG